MRINNRLYSLFERSAGGPTIDISGDVPPAPKLLSRFFSLNKNNVDAVLNNQLYASQADLFNDLFDSSYLKIGSISVTEKFMQNLKDSDGENKEWTNTQLRDTTYNMWLQATGVICMSNLSEIHIKNNSTLDLMWAHYANNSGFMIEFNWEKFPSNFGKPLPVDYHPELKLIEYNDLYMVFFVNSLIKKDCWKYENEYRFFATHPDNKSFNIEGIFSNAEYDYEKVSRLLSYPKKSINKIVFGFNFLKRSDFIGGGIINLHHGESERNLRNELFEYILYNTIPVEVVALNLESFKLETRGFNFTHMDGTKYKYEYGLFNSESPDRASL